MTAVAEAPVVDVNAAFAAERASQIEAAYASREATEIRNRERAAQWDARLASGKLVPQGNGQFKVNDPGSWDDGEVLFMRQPVFGEVPLILPVTGLDKSADGTRDLLYTAVPTWHNAEGVGLVPGGTTDIDAILTLGGIDFTVKQSPVRYRAGNGAYIEVPGSFVNYRSDTRAPLGVVGKLYTPLQPRTQFEFLQDISERYDVPFESAGPLNGGRQVFVSMRVPDGIRIDAEGIDERVEYFFHAINSNDGQGQFRVVATPWRPVCGNTNRFALRDAVSAWGVRHTKSAPDRIAEAQRQLGIVTAYAEAYAADQTKLAQTDTTIDEVRAVLDALELTGFGDKAAADMTVRQRNAERKRSEALMNLWDTESGRVGASLYAAENVITGYIDNEQPRRVNPEDLLAARATAVLVDDKVQGAKNRAHKMLLTLAS